jgi:hypothetical protein
MSDINTLCLTAARRSQACSVGVALTPQATRNALSRTACSGANRSASAAPVDGPHTSIPYSRTGRMWVLIITSLAVTWMRVLAKTDAH